MCIFQDLILDLRKQNKLSQKQNLDLPQKELDYSCQNQTFFSKRFIFK